MKRKEVYHVLITAFISLLVLLFLAYFSHINKYFSWDLVITNFLQGHRNIYLDYFFFGISWPGYPPQVTYLTPFLIILLLLKKWRIEALWETAATALVSMVGYTFKYSVNRPRAPESLIRVVHVGLEGGKYSFPAGHVETYVVILGFLAIVVFLKLNKSLLRSFLVGFLVFLIAFVGPSRVYMGEHWTSDVLGGYLVGLFVLSLVYLGYNGHQYYLNAKKKTK